MAACFPIPRRFQATWTWSSLAFCSAVLMAMPRAALALGCAEIQSLVDAGVDDAVLERTVKEAHPKPKQVVIHCLQHTPGVPESKIAVVAAAAGLTFEPDAVPAEAVEVNPEPAPSRPRVAITVQGMDEAHRNRALEQRERFESVLERMAPQACPRLLRGEVAVRVEYVPDLNQTIGLVTLTGVEARPLQYYPGGRTLIVACPSVVATAAATAWGLQGVVVVQYTSGGLLRYIYGVSPQMGAAPIALRVEAASQTFDVPLYRQAFVTAVVDRPGSLPDGRPNPAARLAELLGEDLSLP